MRTSARPSDRFGVHWADAVFVSGMHIQRQAMMGIAARAHARGKVCALGGPSVSASPEAYPDFDYLHIGEVGDATDARSRRSTATSAARRRSSGWRRRSACPCRTFRSRPIS